jgi:hypothetical protein
MTAINSIARTQADTAGFIPIIWAQRALDVLRAKIVLAKVISRDTDFDTGWRGKTLNIPYPGTFTAQSKTEGNPATVQQPNNAATIPVTLSQHKYVDFVIEDWAQAQANSNLMDRWMNPAVVALAEDLETYLFGLTTGFTTPPVGTTGTNLSHAVITAARVTLNVAKIPMEDRSIIMSPKDEGSLIGDSTLAQYFAYAQNKGITDGEIGMLDGFKLYMSQLAPTQTGTSYTLAVVGTGGTFTLTYNAQTTTALAYNATAAQIAAALAALSSVAGAYNISVTSPSAGNFLITLTGVNSADTTHAITATSSLTGTGAGATVAPSGLTSTRNLAIQKQALLLATRPLGTPPSDSGVQSETIVDPVSGLSLRMQYQYKMEYRGMYVGFDLLYGGTVLRSGNGLELLS